MISINEEKKLLNKKLNSLKKVKNEFTWDIIIQRTIDTIKTFLQRLRNGLNVSCILTAFRPKSAI